MLRNVDLVRELPVGVTSKDGNSNLWDKLLSNQLQTSFKSVDNLDASTLGKQNDSTAAKHWDLFSKIIDGGLQNLPISRQGVIWIHFDSNLLASFLLVLSAGTIDQALNKSLVNITAADSYLAF